MKKYISLLCLFSISSLMAGESKEASLKEPFSSMSTKEVSESGITKLSHEEQEALAKWMKTKKPASKEIPGTDVTLASIQDKGKIIALSDGSQLVLSSSNMKKVSRWAIGDRLKMSTDCKKGTVVLVHVGSGAKVKGKRNPVPKSAPSKSSSDKSEKPSSK